MTTEDTQQICAYVPQSLVRAIDGLSREKKIARARAIELACEEWVRRESQFDCPQCGERVVARMRYCPRCAMPLTPEDAEDLERSVREIKKRSG